MKLVRKAGLLVTLCLTVALVGCSYKEPVKKTNDTKVEQKEEKEEKTAKKEKETEKKKEDKKKSTKDSKLEIDGDTGSIIGRNWDTVDLLKVDLGEVLGAEVDDSYSYIVDTLVTYKRDGDQFNTEGILADFIVSPVYLGDTEYNATMRFGDGFADLRISLDLSETEEIERVITALLGKNAPLTTSEVMDRMTSEQTFTEISTEDYSYVLTFATYDEDFDISVQQEISDIDVSHYDILGKYYDRYDTTPLMKENSPELYELLLDPNDYGKALKKDTEQFNTIQVSSTHDKLEDGYEKNFIRCNHRVTFFSTEDEPTSDNEDLSLIIHMQREEASLDIFEGKKGITDSLPSVLQHVDEIAPYNAWKLKVE